MEMETTVGWNGGEPGGTQPKAAYFSPGAGAMGNQAGETDAEEVVGEIFGK